MSVAPALEIETNELKQLLHVVSAGNNPVQVTGPLNKESKAELAVKFKGFALGFNREDLTEKPGMELIISIGFDLSKWDFSDFSKGIGLGIPYLLRALKEARGSGPLQATMSPNQCATADSKRAPACVFGAGDFLVQSASLPFRGIKYQVQEWNVVRLQHGADRVWLFVWSRRQVR